VDPIPEENEDEWTAVSPGFLILLRHDRTKLSFTEKVFILSPNTK